MNRLSYTVEDIGRSGQGLFFDGVLMIARSPVRLDEVGRDERLLRHG